MSEYDVVALGNALVDTEFQVSDAFLAEQGIEKGVMTLVDRELQLKLLEALYQHCDLRKRAGFCGKLYGDSGTVWQQSILLLQGG